MRNVGCIAAEEKNKQLEDGYQSALREWKNRRSEFGRHQEAYNASLDQLQLQYELGTDDAIEQYCDLVLSQSEYPDSFPKSYELKYLKPARMLVVDYELPVPDDLPRLKSVRYVQSRDEFVETQLPESTSKRLYDSAIYQITIRTLHELFEADVVSALDAVAFNGLVKTTDLSTGQSIRPCIVSVQCTKSEFLDINLAAVEPRACFRKLRGTGSAQLHALSPVAPLVSLPSDDKRYVPGREVVDSMSQGSNLAAMDWEDFEHLIRQLFEREFAQSGADVKVTRASRDGGVDAVILDPDPIRGGKYVVQAKRYTNVVSVSAVRDLYGTMMNEGAVKGILVTTATFGPDSYVFAGDKPITLIDGGNLMHLLQKHGVRCHIDIKAAKESSRQYQL